MKETKFNIKEHSLVPKHIKLSDKEKKEILERYNISTNQLPKILKNDPAIKDLDLKNGDIIKIIRESQTAGKSLFYRAVVHG